MKPIPANAPLREVAPRLRCLSTWPLRYYLVMAALLLGAAERFGWAWLHRFDGSHAGGEFYEAARAFATTGAIADAYRPGQGPTAHLMPLPVIYAGTVYRVFGVGSIAAEFVLLCGAIVTIFVGYALAALVVRALGGTRTMCAAALIFLLIAPLNMRNEVVHFRIWEGALAAALGMGFLVLLLRFHDERRTDLKATLVLSFYAAVLFFVSPALGVAAYCCSLLFMVTRTAGRFWPRSAAIAVAALVIVLSPWTIRNAIVMGHPIPLRSNFGLELAIGMDPHALDAADPLSQFQAHMADLHPIKGDVPYSKMVKAGGEVAYADSLKRRTFAWMKSHPRDATRLILLHIREYFFPSPWMWEMTWRGPLTRGGPQMVATWLLAALGLVGAFWAAFRDRRAVYALLMLLMPVMVYALTQPTLRYRYIGFALLTCFAFDAVGRPFMRLRSLEAAGKD